MLHLCALEQQQPAVHRQHVHRLLCHLPSPLRLLSPPLFTHSRSCPPHSSCHPSFKYTIAVSLRTGPPTFVSLCRTYLPPTGYTASCDAAAVQGKEGSTVASASMEEWSRERREVMGGGMEGEEGEGEEGGWDGEGSQ